MKDYTKDITRVLLIETADTERVQLLNILMQTKAEEAITEALNSYVGKCEVVIRELEESIVKLRNIKHK